VDLNRTGWRTWAALLAVPALLAGALPFLGWLGRPS
jgi:hypothetical protein